MSVHDALDHRQTDTGAIELVFEVQALKHAEQLVHVFHIESDPVVLDVIHGGVDLSFVRQPADLDLCRRSMAGEFEGVRQQIRPHEFQQPPVSLAGRQIADRQIDHPVFLHHPQVLRPFSSQVRHLDHANVHADTAQAGELQQIVDQFARLHGGLLDDAQTALGFGIQMRSMVLFDDADIGVDGAQRRPQVVRDRIGKTLQLIVGVRQRRSLLG